MRFYKVVLTSKCNGTNITFHRIQADNSDQAVMIARNMLDAPFAWSVLSIEII